RKGLGGSEYLLRLHDLTTGDAPDIDLDFEAHLQEALLEAIQQEYVNAAHDISDGGLATTLAEMAIYSGKGATVEVDELGNNPHEVRSTEAQSGGVVTCTKHGVEQFGKHFSDNRTPCTRWTHVDNSNILNIDGLLSLPVSEMHQL